MLLTQRLTQQDRKVERTSALGGFAERYMQPLYRRRKRAPRIAMIGVA
jgi:hypothetical protein